MTWTLEEVALATGGRLVRGDAGTAVDGISTDSRHCEAGALFFALIGPRFDGHAFAAESMQRGACGVVVSRRFALDAGAIIEVPDTERALGDLAAHTRRQRRMAVFGIGGSNGKTTTKEMVAAICAQRWPAAVLKSAGNQNNLIGLPLTLLRWAGETVAVLEMGMNRPGEMARLTEIAQPDYALITNISAEHIEGLGSIDGVAQAEGELFAGLGPEAVAVANADDPWIRAMAQRLAGRVVWFGSGTDTRVEHVADLGADGTAFDLCCADASMRVRLRLAGQHNVRNALAAAAMGRAAGMSLEQIAAGLDTVRPVSMRMEVRRLGNRVTLIDDSYNANPASMEAALQTLVSLPGRSLAVLGEMLELGADAEEAHRRLGERAAALGVDVLVVVGEVAEVVASGAHANGMRAGSVVVCRDHAEAVAAVRERWHAGDAVLVKGSRGARMEIVATLLEQAGTQS